ncbi:MAG: aldo/keto reductase [Armatimonadetes bacterium]|nr:aldo/keto reductase [Armatimonadota bacterium]
MTDYIRQPSVTINPVTKRHCALGLGCWVFGGTQWGGQEDSESVSAMDSALDLGITHFDTASGYGGGRSESVVGDFLQGKRERVFLASKFFPGETTTEYVLQQIDASLDRLRTDFLDLYYMHWPNSSKDLRPVMEGLERARSQGKIRSIGVSNFSVEQMEQIAGAGRIDAHQVCYNLYWRFPEKDVIPYCRERDIAVVTYSSIAQGVLTGKFPREPQFKEGDQRPHVVFFEAEVWPHLYEGVEELKKVSTECGRSLTHLAIRWVMSRPGIISVLVGARNGQQFQESVAALEGEIPQRVFDQMTGISDSMMSHVPDVGNIFRYYP